MMTCSQDDHLKKRNRCSYFRMLKVAKHLNIRDVFKHKTTLIEKIFGGRQNEK